MVDKLEVGKTYRLVDREGFIGADKSNLVLVSRFFKGSEVTIKGINVLGNAVCGAGLSILQDEAIFFEEVADTKVDESEGMSPIEEAVEQTMRGLEEAGVTGVADVAQTINGDQVGYVEPDTGSPCERSIIGHIALNIAQNVCLNLSVEDVMDRLLSAWVLQGKGYMEYVGCTDKSVIVTGECADREMFKEAWKVFGKCGMKVVFVDMWDD